MAVVWSAERRPLPFLCKPTTRARDPFDGVPLVDAVKDLEEVRDDTVTRLESLVSKCQRNPKKKEIRPIVAVSSTDLERR